MSFEESTILALNGLQFIAGDDHLLTRFMDQTGMTPDLVAERASDPEFQGGVLDFILSDDQIALDFCAAFDHRPEELMLMRRRLPGASLEQY